MAGHSSSNDDFSSQINVTPLVDVLLVLLLVLMVSASAAVARSLKVNLPAASRGEAAESPLVISVAPDGAYSLAERRLTALELASELQSRGEPASLSVILAADGAAAHRHVIELLDTLSGIGVTRVAFAVRGQEHAP